MKQSIVLVLGIPFVLAACSTSVVSDEERVVPTEEAVLVDAQPPAQPAPTPAPTPAPEQVEEVKEEATVQPFSHEADLSKSLLSFIGAKGSLVSHEGKFTDYTFSFASPGKIEDGAINLSINISSMLTDSESLTEHLIGDRFFDAANHPTATFASESIQALGDDKYNVSGNLTLKGLTKSITFGSIITDRYMVMKYDLDRTQFNVGPPAEGVKAIDANVPVEAKFVFK